jgi:hypothetical protein
VARPSRGFDVRDVSSQAGRLLEGLQASYLQQACSSRPTEGSKWPERAGDREPTLK